MRIAGEQDVLPGRPDLVQDQVRHPVIPFGGIVVQRRMPRGAGGVPGMSGSLGVKVPCAT
jgi:hypothetical protein